MSARKDRYRELLDRVLAYAIGHTDDVGRVVIDGEIDCKDSGWLVLAGVIRMLAHGGDPPKNLLLPVIEKWTAASVNVDDRRSAWTTFCLLYATYLSGGREGSFYSSLGTKMRSALDHFVLQLDIKFLREASKNYHVAAGIINALRVRLGYLVPEELDRTPDEDIKVMLDAYLGDGFFNDDDIRGSRADRRIDHYSGEIIGLLLHYDEIHGWNSCWHERIAAIIRDYAAVHSYFTDAEGEYAKWGRSLRGEAELKKIFLWEYAEAHGLVPQPGAGIAMAQSLLAFSERTGIDPEGRIGRDKAFNRGIWDEYTTNVQAQGYGAYGLAMALRFCSGGKKNRALLPSEQGDFLKYFPNSGFIVSNFAGAKIHYVVPVRNRLSKLMYLWHNRITGENDVSVDMSAKFMPLPYFGHKLPLPYSTRKYPFLPYLKLNGGRELYPKNVLDAFPEVIAGAGCCRVIYHFAYCDDLGFAVRDNRLISGWVDYRVESIYFYFELPPPHDVRQIIIPFYSPERYRIKFHEGEASFEKDRADPSIYGQVKAVAAAIEPSCRKISYSIEWEKKPS